MDSTAIQEIQKLAISAIAKGQLENFLNSATVIPDNWKLQTLEHLQSQPDHFRGHFTTTALAEFIGYANQHGSENTGVFIDPDSMTAAAIIDLGNHTAPEWGKHRASATLKPTPAYAALLKSADETLQQQAFIDFIEDWAGPIEFYFEDGELSDAATAVKTLRRLKVNANAEQEQTVGNFAASRSALETIEIRAGYEKLPAGFCFIVDPYEGFEQHTFNCQLRAVSDDKAVKLKYRIGQLEMIKEAIANEFRDRIKAGITEQGVSIFLGQMAYQK